MISFYGMFIAGDYSGNIADSAIAVGLLSLGRKATGSLRFANRLLITNGCATCIVSNCVHASDQLAAVGSQKITMIWEDSSSECQRCDKVPFCVHCI